MPDNDHDSDAFPCCAPPTDNYRLSGIGFCLEGTTWVGFAPEVCSEAREVMLAAAVAIRQGAVDEKLAKRLETLANTFKDAE